MNRALYRLSLACLAMFVLLLINVNYVQAFEANSLAGRPGNARTFSQQFQYQRGSIIVTGVGGNKTIAESVPIKGTNMYQRFYPDGATYAPVTGFDSIYGATGIEKAYDKYLAGTATSLTVHNLISLLTGKPKQGATVYLTIIPAAQQAAYQALRADGGHQAAAVALDPTTGAILAMASYPSYNPNLLTTLNGTQLVKVDNELLKDPAQPLLNRAINETYPPGSSFKVVTGSAACCRAARRPRPARRASGAPVPGEIGSASFTTPLLLRAPGQFAQSGHGLFKRRLLLARLFQEIDQQRPELVAVGRPA